MIKELQDHLKRLCGRYESQGLWFQIDIANISEEEVEFIGCVGLPLSLYDKSYRVKYTDLQEMIKLDVATLLILFAEMFAADEREHMGIVR